MTATTINWFEIPVANLDRAQAFYEKVLGRTLKREDMGGAAMAVFPYEEPATGGCLMAGGPLRRRRGQRRADLSRLHAEHRRRAVARGAGRRAGRDAEDGAAGRHGLVRGAARHRGQRSRAACPGLTP